MLCCSPIFNIYRLLKLQNIYILLIAKLLHLSEVDKAYRKNIECFVIISIFISNFAVEI